MNANNPERSALIACVQMTTTDSVEHNLATAQRLVANAAERGAQIVVLPETFAFMGDEITQQFGVAEAFGDGPIQTAVADWAKSNHVWIVAGTIPLRHESDRERVRAACLVFDDSGQCQARYDKVHLFDVELPTGESYKESSVFLPGDEIAVLDTPLGRMGVAVCYDLRFPELFRAQLDMGMEFCVLPSAFTEATGQAHWLPLLQARAVENLCYFAAAAQVGEHGSGRRTHGHSVILDPWGQVVDQLAEGEGVVVGSIDMEHQRLTRANFPALQHRRLSTRRS
ncbi:nitrilase/cyanide hydratase and apolipoprotein N-acyltransferase [gamma proteobacterium HTCC5015]|nr:nitrilase/cyanide hydratase and apolipoprotein N-acyltransferase [gamma proteobacterium HTCC5015]